MISSNSQIDLSKAFPWLRYQHPPDQLFVTKNLFLLFLHMRIRTIQIQIAVSQYDTKLMDFIINNYFRYTKGRWSIVPKHSIIHWSSLLTVYITHVPNTLLQKIIRIKNSKDHKSLFTTGQRSEFFRDGNFLCL